MSKLKAATKNKLPKKEFGLPNERKFPMEDKNNARNAKSRSSEMVHKGKLSKSSEEKIDAKANKILSRGKK